MRLLSTLLAAVLAMSPDILILDEAFSRLDKARAERMRGVIRSVAAGGTAVIMIDHDERNLAMADDTLTMEGGRISSRRLEGEDGGT